MQYLRVVFQIQVIGQKALSSEFYPPETRALQHKRMRTAYIIEIMIVNVYIFFVKNILSSRDGCGT